MNGATTLSRLGNRGRHEPGRRRAAGTTVNITETPFDLAAHSVYPAGEYMIAAHIRMNGAGGTTVTNSQQQQQRARIGTISST